MARILVVDDDQAVRRLVTRILGAAGYELSEAEDGEQALAAALAAPPDLILLDLNLPKLDGFEVCARLRQDARTQAVPIVMLTAAYDSVDDAQRGLAHGANEYIVKPFLREVLLFNVQRLLDKRPAVA